MVSSGHHAGSLTWHHGKHIGVQLVKVARINVNLLLIGWVDGEGTLQVLGLSHRLLCMLDAHLEGT